MKQFSLKKRSCHKSLRKIFQGKIFALLLVLSQAQAQVELRSDSNHVETGNPFALHLHLPISLGKPDSLRFAVWESALPIYNIIGETDWNANGSFYHKTLNVLFFEEDTVKLQSLPIFLSTGDTVYTNPLEIIVIPTPSPDDLNDMASMKDIQREPVRWTDFLPWILSALAVLTLLCLLFWLASGKVKTRVRSRTMETPAHTLALKKLDLLSKKHLTANGLVKEHYTELTFILREFLEKRFSIPALESTTTETMLFLKDRGFPAQLSNLLQNLLEQSDLAKFAKIIPDDTFLAESFEVSKKIILETAREVENL